MPGTIEERLKDFEHGIEAAVSTFRHRERNAPNFMDGWRAARRYYKEGVVEPFPEERIMEQAKKARLEAIHSASRGAKTFHLPRARARFEKEAAEEAAAAAAAPKVKKAAPVKRVASKR